MKRFDPFALVHRIAKHKWVWTTDVKVFSPWKKR